MKQLIISALLLALLLPLAGHAQLAGSNTKGDFGLQAGTQAPPGFYVIPLFYEYKADTLRDRNGDSRSPLGGGGSVDAQAAIAGFMWVTENKILGGNYSFAVWPGVTNNALGFPSLQFDEKVGTGLADLYVQPITLGWNTAGADFLVGLGLYAPTGEFEADGDNNRGLGMWTYELFGGTTLYFDEAKSWHFAALASYETHGEKDGTDIRVGDILTLEGGLGKSFKGGLFNAGIAYYAQWKISDDEFGQEFKLPGGQEPGRHRIYGIGPELTIPLMSKSTLYGSLNLRYFWESGARSTLEGNTFLATLSFPVPSVPLQ